MTIYRKPVFYAVLLGLAMGSGGAIAENGVAELRKTVDMLQRQLEEVQKQLQEQESRTASKDDVAALKKDLTDVNKVHSEWKNADSVVHLAGYGSVGYTDDDISDGRFSQVQFAPIFHYQYQDLMMLESELEIQAQADGSTDINLEYLTLDLFLNDYMTLVGGKFLSPIGQFRQNFHPSWINKLPSAPSGFGHDGAAPVADVGMQLRGGFPLGAMRANYAAFVANGPELEAVTEDGEVELEAIGTEGFANDADGNKVIGGRFGLLPMPGLEIAISLASGEVAVTTLDGSAINGNPSRDYDVIGADFNWQWGNVDLRGEYVKQKVGASSSGLAAERAEWKSWYTQAAYKFLPTKWEGVVRYSDFDSPHPSEDQEQWAIGANYLFAANVIAKIAYESNESQPGAAADEDRILLQMAYGF